MFESLRNLFKRKNNAPHEDVAPTTQPVRQDNGEPDWEQRRFELVKMLVAQDRRSVVLGKLRATNKAIANNARKLADAAIRELQTNPLSSHDGGGEEND